MKDLSSEMVKKHSGALPGGPQRGRGLRDRVSAVRSGGSGAGREVSLGFQLRRFKGLE